MLTHTSKQGLINMINEFDDDAIFAVSSELHGDLKVVKKDNVKSIPFAFQASSFKRDETVGDIVKGEVMTFAVCVLNQETASQTLLDTISETKKSET